jgi:hypothetical protein
MSVPILHKVYSFMNKLGFIDTIPSNLDEISKDLYLLNDIHHYVYLIVSNNTINNKEKIRHLNDLGIFTDDNINYIIENKKKIIEPIEAILKKRWSNKVTIKSGGFKSRHPSPEIEITDWVFFPLWSIENAPIIGPFAGIPLDFISITLANMDMVVDNMTKVVESMRDPLLQSAMSAFTVGTAGVGAAVTPFIIPAVNNVLDLFVHMTAHSIDMINMFFNISRKNFGLAYLLLMEIIPPLNVVIDKLINYIVIFNRSIKRNIKFVDMLIDYIDIYEETVKTLLYPQAALYKNIEPYKGRLHGLIENIDKLPVEKIPIVSNFATSLKYKITDMLKKIELKINEFKPKKKENKQKG